MGARGVQPLNTDIVLGEAVDVDDAARLVLRLLRDAREDGVVSLLEAERIYQAAVRTVVEAREVVTAAELAYAADKVIDNLRRGGRVAPQTARHCRELGLPVPEIDRPQSAA